MGAWGLGSFENDGAADLLWDLREADDGTALELLKAVLTAAANCPQDTYLGAHLGQAAVAAAELTAPIIANPRGRARPSEPPPFDPWHRASAELAWEWLRRTQASADADLTGLALRAIDRVRVPMLELIGEEAQREWSASIDDLEERLGTAP